MHLYIAVKINQVVTHALVYLDIYVYIKKIILGDNRITNSAPMGPGAVRGKG